MGDVYRAKDTKLGRDVALNFSPRRSPRSRTRVARFRREAQLLAARGIEAPLIERSEGRLQPWHRVDCERGW
jgi:hypothetical protein